MIKVYTNPGCGPCIALKRWLHLEGYPFEELDAGDNIEDVVELGIRKVPAFVYGEHVVQGFNLPAIKEALHGFVR